MAQQSPDYKQLFLEEKTKRLAAERAQVEAERAQIEAERAQAEAENAQAEAENARGEERRLREEAEEKMRPTTLPEFLDACHVHLYSGLTLQKVSLSTQGDPANAADKIRPDRILAWDDFPISQEAVWKDLQRSSFFHRRHFKALSFLEGLGETIRDRSMGSELDLNYFARSTVEDHVASIIKQLYNSPSLRTKFRLKGSVIFENHANTLSPEQDVEALSGRRRSPRLLAQAAESSGSSGLGESTRGATAGAVGVPRPRADQFCVYNITSETGDPEYRVAALVVEYKAPHKLELGCIYEGLQNMELDEVTHCSETDSPRDRIRRLIAAAITQAFSYMVQAGLEYGYIYTGEAIIFLRVPDNPDTVYYFLSVPSGDVGETTGLVSDIGGQNRLHLTAVGQVLAFTLQALKRRPRSQEWRNNAAARLQRWAVVYNVIFDSISPKDIPSSEYRPSPHQGYFRMSPIRLRSKVSPLGCQSPLAESQYSDDESDPDPETPSRPYQRPTTQRLRQAQNPMGEASSGQSSRYESKQMQYCTQKCLLGLVDGRPLDQTCPNASDHGKSHHQIDRHTFLKLVRQQLSANLDIDCMPVGVNGARGVLFMVRLTSHGYILAAKCTTIDFVTYLKREAAIYERLIPIQGIHVPVCLGSIDLDQSYNYDGIAEIVHMMFLGFGGRPIYHDNKIANSVVDLIQKLERSVRAIHQRGVLHQDLRPRNILWNAELDQTMIIDFERAEIQESRAVLGAISPNQKRKRASMSKGQQGNSMVWELRQCLNSIAGERIFANVPTLL
ncbi:MAG: hypothetical protein Q9163_005121 [Psora crenata]